MRIKAFIIIFTFSMIVTGCGQRNIDSSGNGDISKDVYYTLKGYYFALGDNYMVVVEEEGLEIIDLNTKEVIKELEVPNGPIGGFDINGTKVVWSAYSSSEDIGKDYWYDETTNTDVFLYNITDDSTIQITNDAAGQIVPKVWEDYIVWQDNRNDNADDMNPEWDICLYNISTKEEKIISTAPGIHTNPSINDNKVVWEDGRQFEGQKELRWGGNVPENNTDIYLYDIKTGMEEAIAAGPLQECNPTVYGNYIAWEDRNERGFAADIYLYDLNEKQTIQITDDKHDQRNPKLFDHYIVWMDERHGGSSNDVIMNGQQPNSDIFLYDIDLKKEYLLTGKEPQVMPAISANYIGYITSRQINPETQVIKYKPVD